MQLEPDNSQADPGPLSPLRMGLWELSEPNFSTAAATAAATAARMAVFATALAPDLERAPEPPGGLLTIQFAGLHSAFGDAAGPGRA